MSKLSKITASIIIPFLLTACPSHEQDNSAPVENIKVEQSKQIKYTPAALTDTFKKALRKGTSNKVIFTDPNAFEGLYKKQKFLRRAIKSYEITEEHADLMDKMLEEQYPTITAGFTQQTLKDAVLNSLNKGMNANLVTHRRKPVCIVNLPHDVPVSESERVISLISSIDMGTVKKIMPALYEKFPDLDAILTRISARHESWHCSHIVPKELLIKDYMSPQKKKEVAEKRKRFNFVQEALADRYGLQG
ncbi:hypothetical protein PN36_25185 [Candidatus Thiomargarita nelsonii]|uniref:Lipoprotein n=1 Tax=Candidatus Thiomargarita nelsonii TaxID=1003181 RepID=A0A4E0RPU8_9GAMM|nr:hypothetical protein PN36_25185 [Candidatus Thiomargarita nelsonii]